MRYINIRLLLLLHAPSVRCSDGVTGFITVHASVNNIHLRNTTSTPAVLDQGLEAQGQGLMAQGQGLEAKGLMAQGQGLEAKGLMAQGQ